jgi:hypothetical protein
VIGGAAGGYRRSVGLDDHSEHAQDRSRTMLSGCRAEASDDQATSGV